MASPQRQYTNELHDRFGYIATWLPGVPVRLGDIGIMGPHGFEYVTNLKNFGIAFRVRRDSNATSYQYASAGAVSVSFNAAADAPVLGQVASQASAGVTVEMSRANAVLFVVQGARSPSIENQEELGRQVLDLHEAGRWQENYLVVTEVLEASCGTVLISSDSNARVEIAASGNATINTLELANAQLGLRVRSSRNLHTQILASEGMTPLFRARGVKRRLLGLGSAIFRSPAQAEVTELTPADLTYEE